MASKARMGTSMRNQPTPMNRVCPDCKHLIFAADIDEHECVSDEYLARRDKMLNEALEAEERYGLDFLDP